MNKPGLDAFVKSFSWPGKSLVQTAVAIIRLAHLYTSGGFPSHVNAETPGQIHEGGELGYALAVAYGSVFDSPDLITVAIIGDGEAETGYIYHLRLRHSRLRSFAAVRPLQLGMLTNTWMLQRAALSCLF